MHCSGLDLKRAPNEYKSQLLPRVRGAIIAQSLIETDNIIKSNRFRQFNNSSCSVPRSRTEKKRGKKNTEEAASEKGNLMHENDSMALQLSTLLSPSPVRGKGY